MSASIIVHLIFLTTLLTISNEEPRSKSVQHLVDEWMGKQPAGAVAVALVSPNGMEYYFSGNLEPKNKSLPDEHTMFEIGSITKGFTGLLLADQVLAGKVLLNDTLATLLTDWPGRFNAPAGNVTLLELTTHSSGLPRLPDNMEPLKHPDNPYADYTLQNLYDWLDKAELSNRSLFRYSNVGIGILGHALATVAGKKYEDFLKERVLIPLGLQDTTITLNADQKRRIAPGHDENGTLALNWDLNVFESAGALRSSIAELAHFLQFTTGLHEDDKQKGLWNALEFAIQPLGKTDKNDTAIGCNWFRREDNLLIHHNGATGGYNSFIGWMLNQQIGVSVLASITGGENNTADDLGLDVLKHGDGADYDNHDDDDEDGDGDSDDDDNYDDDDDDDHDMP